MDTLFGILMIAFVFLFSYVGYHMAVEKDKGEHIPLAWEEDGFLYRLFQKLK